MMIGFVALALTVYFAWLVWNYLEPRIRQRLAGARIAAIIASRETEETEERKLLAQQGEGAKQEADAKERTRFDKLVAILEAASARGEKEIELSGRDYRDLIRGERLCRLWLPPIPPLGFGAEGEFVFATRYGNITVSRANKGSRSARRTVR